DGVGHPAQFRYLRRDELTALIVSEEATRREEALLASRFAGLHRPYCGIEALISIVRQRSERPDVEITSPIVFKSGEGGMFMEDVGRSVIVEGCAKAEAACDFAHDQPIGLRLT